MKNIDFYQVSLKAILKNWNWETLILKVSEKEYEKFWKYDFPGWRIDEDEFLVNHLDILKREIKEELWDEVIVNFKNSVVWIWRHQGSKSRVFYIVFEWTISWNINISSEHKWYEFIKLEEINQENYFKSWLLQVVKMYLNK